MIAAIYIYASRLVYGFAIAVACFIVASFVHDEIHTSHLQARLISGEAQRHFYWLEEGTASHRVSTPDGPLDRQRGYTEIPRWTQRLSKGDFEVTWQAGVSPPMAAATERGLYPAYDPTHQAGLTIIGRDASLLHEHRTPGKIFDDLDDLPDLLVKTLLFIENRQLLEPGFDHRNPAVEWQRFAHAFIALVRREAGVDDEHFGGSTLATQLQKFRHSPGGVTADEKEKIRQMASASLRAYRFGPRTAEHQRLLVLDYLNGVPLAASPGYGEVQGLPDGLRVWFGADPDEVLESLQRLESTKDTAFVTAEDARAYRMVLSLFLAQRRPTYYLVAAPKELAEFTDSYLRVLAGQEVISPALRDAALAEDAPILARAPAPARPDFVEQKAVDAVRASLLNALDVTDLYSLDRYDLYVQSTIDGRAQRKISQMLRRIDDPEFIEEHQLYGHRLLHRDAPLEELTVSFTLFERTPRGNALRILADNHDQPLNINEHVKLDLGSTAKLRTLVTYLEVVEMLHHELAPKSEEELRQIARSAPDGLRRWTAQTLANSDEPSLENTLQAAMNRQYSASPDQTFFTGGGLHRFSNFEHRRNHTQSVHEAFRHSVNLVFIRMMRDIADYYMWLDPQRMEKVLGDEDTEERRYLLSRFADREGAYFQGQFFPKYAGLPPEQIPATVVDGRNLSPASLAMIAMIFSDQTPEGLRQFVEEHGGYSPDDNAIERWFNRYHTDVLNWQDRGHLTRIHPLELWIASWLYDHPESTFSQAIVASRDVRQQVYQWLFRTRSRARQDQRLRIVLEEEAFDQIHHTWRRLGYPFDDLVPSLATSIGSSADRPLALAELLGIIQNDGVRLPEVRVDALIAAPETPYETRFERLPHASGERLLSKPVARTLQNALVDVVEKGTARRIRGQLHDSKGNAIVVGGKTGTGDHDHKVYDGLRLIESRPVHRTATFAFFLDDRFFGTITVFVSGEPAGQFRFTSALPTMLLKTIYPEFAHLIEGAGVDDGPLASTGPGQPLTLAALGKAPVVTAAPDDQPLLTATSSLLTADSLDWESALAPDPLRGFESTGRTTSDSPPFDWDDLFQLPLAPEDDDADEEPSA